MIKLNDNERALYEVRKHPYVMIASAAALALAALIPLAFLLALGTVGTLSAELIRNATPLALFLYSLWLLGLWAFLFIEWTDYYLDVWIVTERRIVDVEQLGLFHREVISLEYDDIQDITVETRGIFQSLFGFGDLHVQTAGAKREIVLRNARDPEAARTEIMRLQSKAKDEYKLVKVVEGGNAG